MFVFLVEFHLPSMSLLHQWDDGRWLVEGSAVLLEHTAALKRQLRKCQRLRSCVKTRVGSRPASPPALVQEHTSLGPSLEMFMFQSLQYV